MPIITLSEEQANQFQDFLNRKGVSKKCPYCHTGIMAIENKLAMLTIDPALASRAFAVLLCNNCYHTAFFLADPILRGEDIYGL